MDVVDVDFDAFLYPFQRVGAHGAPAWINDEAFWQEGFYKFHNFNIILSMFFVS